MLTILPINFTGIKTIPIAKDNKNVKTSSLKKDAFQKTIDFTGRIGFESWMFQNNLTLNDIKSIISNKDSEIGSGNSHTTFSIPNCKEYCIRILTNDIEGIKTADFSQAKFLDVEDKNLKINIGQKVGLITVQRDLPFPYQIEILRRQEGESIGVQPPETLVTGDFYSVQKEGVAPYEDYSRKEKYARTIHEVAKLPVEAYEKLIQEFNEGQEAGYSFDYLNSNNLLVDSKEGKINLIDMEQGCPCDLSGLLYALTNAQYYNTFVNRWCEPVDDVKINQATKDTIAIIRKFAQALKNQGIALNRYEAPYEATISLYSSMPCLMAFGVVSEPDVWNKMEKMGIAKQ